MDMNLNELKYLTNTYSYKKYEPLTTDMTKIIIQVVID